MRQPYIGSARSTRIAPVTGTIDPERELEAIRSLAPLEGRRVLELGCGEGRLTRPLAVLAASVTAIDTDEKTIARARASLPDVDLRVASAIDLDAPDGEFDLALFSWSL
jgi:2-polyprenyl-3-methyl-5-hydroxy-6-metoxy-1,4-benzoquinol methylase